MNESSITRTPTQPSPNAEALIIATEWMEFRSPDFDRIKDALNQPLIFERT